METHSTPEKVLVILRKTEHLGRSAGSSTFAKEEERRDVAMKPWPEFCQLGVFYDLQPYDDVLILSTIITPNGQIKLTRAPGEDEQNLGAV